MKPFYAAACVFCLMGSIILTVMKNESPALLIAILLAPAFAYFYAQEDNQ